MLPAVASVSDTTASGPGITYMIAGQTMNFDIEARDIYGNVAAAINADGSQLMFAVEIVGATTLSTTNGLVTVGSQVDGKFPVSYTGPTETGEYTISIDSAGAPIFGSPFEGIICDTTTDAGWVRAESQGGVFSATNGDEQWFTLIGIAPGVGLTHPGFESCIACRQCLGNRDDCQKDHHHLRFCKWGK